MVTDDATVLRCWTGWIRPGDRDRYADYVERTGLTAYRATPGNRGAFVLMRDLDDGRTEVRTVSLWRSRDDIVAFAGADISRAVFYPDDDQFLIDRETAVTHFDVVRADRPGDPADPGGPSETP